MNFPRTFWTSRHPKPPTNKLQKTISRFASEADEIQTLLREAVAFVLRSQFVINDATGARYRVNTGSGMGGPMSCELCDQALYNIAEANFALLPAIQAQYGIKGYTRFRDDIVLIFSNGPLFHAFLRRLRAIMKGIWKFNVEQVSRYSVSMLDITISIPTNSEKCRVAWKPFFKPSSKAVPLATTSCHPQACHHWPAADLIRLARNSNTLHDFECAKLHSACNLLAKDHDHAKVVDLLLNNPFSYRFAPSRFLAQELRGSRARTLTLVTTYHPRLLYYNTKNGIDKVAHDHADMLERLFGFRLKIRQTNRNAGPPIALQLRKQMQEQLRGR